jgi:hypothetical protein
MKMKNRSAALLAAVVMAGCGSDGGSRIIEPPTGPGSTTLAAPVPQSPLNDVQLTTLRPTLTVTNSTSPVSGARTYEFQISDTSNFASSVTSHIAGLMVVITQPGVPEGAGGTTSFTPAQDLQPATRMYWRARVTQGSASSDWSASGQFRTGIVGFNRNGELYDPLAGSTLGTRSGSTTFIDGKGLRVNNANSWVRYQLVSTITKGEISVEVEGLQANGPGQKSRIFSMMDGGSNLFDSKFLFNVQYRGLDGNPNNAISYKVLMGDDDLKYEPSLSQRVASVRSLNPNTTYLWTANWGSTFRLVVRSGGASGSVLYDRTHSTPGTYNPSPHRVYLGANDAADESGSYAGATYRNLWVGKGPRPASLGSALIDR